MRKVSIVIIVCFALALGLTVMGQGGRELPAVMKDIGAIWQAPGNLGGRGAGLTAPMPDLAKIAEDSAKLQSLFTEAQGIFTKMKMADAAGIAKEAADAAGAAAKEAKGGKLADAAATKTAIGKCQGCHAKYKGEADGAGSFKIKTQ
jgi:hypothetical protein